MATMAVAPCSHRGTRHCLAQPPAVSATPTAPSAAPPVPPPAPFSSRQRALIRWRAGTRLAAAYTTTSSRASCSGSCDSFAGPTAVDIAIEPGPSNSRCIWAGVDVAAPAAGVYGALTAYEDLGTFIPGLAENRCLERYPDGCKLLQVGQQELGLGLRFCARVCLRITEFPGGVPRRMLSRGWSGSAKGGGSASSSSGGGSTAGWWPFVGSGAIPGFPGRGSSSSSSGNPSTSSSNSSSSSSDEEQLFSERRYLRPRSPLGGAPSMDVAFQALEGDFTVFKGLWRVQAAGPAACRLSYSLFVRPQPWLLVGLVEQRIQAEITANLAAVKAQVER